MLVFMNILIVLKMAASAFTSSLYFVRSSFMKKLDTPAIVILSFLYATSGYVMLFYQNVIWLDMMYLFPLLLLSLEKAPRRLASMVYTRDGADDGCKLLHRLHGGGFPAAAGGRLPAARGEG